MKIQSRLGVTIPEGGIPFGQLLRGSALTITDSYVTIDFNFAKDNVLVANTTADHIEIPSDGDYEIVFGCLSISGAANRNVRLQLYDGVTLLKGVTLTKAADEYMNFSFIEVFSLLAGATISAKISYDNAIGSGTDIAINNAKLIVKKLS